MQTSNTSRNHYFLLKIFYAELGTVALISLPLRRRYTRIIELYTTFEINFKQIVVDTISKIIANQ